MNDVKDVFRRRSFWATVILVLAVFVASLILVIYIRNFTREECYVELEDATSETIDKIEGEFTADRNKLRLVSRIISMTEENLDSLSIRRSLNTYKVNSVISDIAILMPDNQVITVWGEILDAEGVLDYKEVKKRGEHISTLQPDLDVPGQYNLRNYVPIRRSGRIIAFLYTTFIPDITLDAWVPDIYSGNANITIVDRETGMIIADTGGRQLQYIDNVDIDISKLSIRYKSFADAIIKAQTGYATGLDKTSGEKMFYSFAPMHMEKWEMIVSVPEKDVFEAVNSMNRALFLCLMVEAVALLLYFSYIVQTTVVSLAGMEKKASIDALTGMQNRNQFEEFCHNWDATEEGMACIYVDVNGLHELNNKKGHLAGDTMLKAVSEVIGNEFGLENCYRIGGDEFVIFKHATDETTVRDDLERVIEIIEFQGYHVAAGVSLTGAGKPLQKVIKESEKEMYRNKKNYYKALGKEMR